MSEIKDTSDSSAKLDLPTWSLPIFILCLPVLVATSMAEIVLLVGFVLIAIPVGFIVFAIVMLTIKAIDWLM